MRPHNSERTVKVFRSIMKDNLNEWNSLLDSTKIT